MPKKSYFPKTGETGETQGKPGANGGKQVTTGVNDKCGEARANEWEPAGVSRLSTLGNCPQGSAHATLLP